MFILFIIIFTSILFYLEYETSKTINKATNIGEIQQIPNEYQHVYSTPMCSHINGDIKKFKAQAPLATHALQPKARANYFPLK